MKDKKTLLTVADGPEGIEIYSSEDEAIVDGASRVPALYLTAAINGAHIKLGPFYLITEELLDRAKRGIDA